MPNDVSVVGYDDTFGADFCPTPLTTLAGPVDEAASTAMEMLLEQIPEPDRTWRPQEVTLPSSLTVRHSTGPAGR